MKTKPSTRGGPRPGAGRKPGTGRYGEPTQTVRLPIGAVATVQDFLAAYEARHRTRRLLASQEAFIPDPDPSRLILPLYAHRVPAGFPSPADDYVASHLDLNEFLVPHREATFFVKVKGHSMTGAGIHDGDMLVVDRAIEPSPGRIIIAVLDGELTVKRLGFRDGRPVLKAENPRFKDIELEDAQELQCWGVVTSCIRKLV